MGLRRTVQCRRDGLCRTRIAARAQKPNGLLRIGLYSEHARRVLKPARELAKRHGWRGDTHGIRAFRQHVLNAPADDPRRLVLRAADFFSTSECRDLIFHVNEQDFSLERIAQTIDKFELEFIGFELANEQVVALGGTPQGNISDLMLEITRLNDLYAG